MSKFKRASLAGSEELFRSTRPEVLPEEVAEVVEHAPIEKLYRRVNLTPEEIDLLIESVQVAKYPERSRPKPSLDKFQRLDGLRSKLQGELPA
jgi:hypothetical protein